MISYRANFDNALDYYLFNLIKKLNHFPKFQIRILVILLTIGNSKKLQALYLYLLSVNNFERRRSKPLIDFVLDGEDDLYRRLDAIDLHLNPPLIKVAGLQKTSASHLMVNFESNVTYIFDKSGFFSTILTLININFLCKMHNIVVNFDSRNWGYPFDLNLIFENLLTPKGVNLYSGQDELFLKSREYVDEIQKTNQDAYSEYVMFRYTMIKKIFDVCNLYLDSETLKQLHERMDFTTCFIRRGDKLRYEAYPLTVANYAKAFERYEKLLVIGDDYYFNNRLVMKNKSKFSQWCLSGYRIKGGYVDNTSNNAMASILSNFYLLCIAKNIIGDANCNLVAAAMICRGDLYTDCLRLHPWKLKNYV